MRLLQSARIRLTLWYLVIIALISFIFSFILYREYLWEISSGYKRAAHHLSVQGVPDATIASLLDEEYRLVKNITFLRFAMVNGIILVSSGVAGYFLAGKTLGPIQEMVDEQKRFIADASHELRTPLASMKTETEVTLRDKSVKKKELKDLLNSNLQEIDRMKKLSDYLLTLSRYETVHTEIPTETVDIKEVINKAISNNAAKANEKDIKIKTRMDEAKINGNKASLIELFSTLIDNAIKYSPTGKKIEILLKRHKRSIVTKIKDQGEGINPKDIPHIFDRFYRAESSRSKQKVDGYGLGLAIAKSIVEMHKGDIDVDSSPGKGTTFKITLPL